MTRCLLLVLSWVLLVATMASAQSERSLPYRNNHKSEDTIVVDVWAAAEPDPAVSAQAAPAALSRDFAASAMRAAAEIRDWQLHLAYTLQSGLPLSESGIASDRDRAADALQLAALTAEGEADRAALMQLVNLFGDAQSWTDARVEDNRNLRLGNYSVSASALDDDESFQNNVSCANSLTSMLASRRFSEETTCR